MELNFVNSFVVVVVLIIVLAIFLVLFGIKRVGKKGGLSNEKKKELGKKFRIIKTHISVKEKIIDYDKLYHKILLELGYVGDFGSILKQEPKVINDLNKIWELHKLRNKLVHDFDLIAENVLKRKAKEYEEEVKKIIK